MEKDNNENIIKKVDNDDGEGPSSGLNINRMKKVSAVYEVDLYDDIGDLKDYHDLLKLLREKEEEKQILLHINSGGGYVHTGLSIINAMKRCRFPILGMLDGIAASMAGIILMHCDKIIVEPESVLMIHHYSGMEWGKGQELMASINSSSKVFKSLLTRTYKKFLTKDEMSDIFKGEDLYFSGKELKSRLKACKKLLEI